MLFRITAIPAAAVGLHAQQLNLRAVEEWQRAVFKGSAAVIGVFRSLPQSYESRYMTR
jgi:hypothetical protein